MATMEQCENRLREILQTADDLVRLRKKCGHLWGHHLNTNTMWNAAEMIESNIVRIVDQAKTKGNLDRLSIELGLASESESKRIGSLWEGRRSWIAIMISAIALIVSIIALSR